MHVFNYFLTGQNVCQFHRAQLIALFIDTRQDHLLAVTRHQNVGGNFCAGLSFSLQDNMSQRRSNSSGPLVACDGRTPNHIQSS